MSYFDSQLKKRFMNLLFPAKLLNVAILEKIFDVSCPFRTSPSGN